MEIALRPYMLRALHQWLSDNGLTPYVLVDATQFGVIVPREYVENGQIVLNISERATGALVISNDNLQFSARFGGVSRNISVPIPAVLGIYAKENGAGAMFEADEYKQTSANSSIQKDAIVENQSEKQNLNSTSENPAPENPTLENSATENPNSEQKTNKAKKFPSHLKIVK